MSKGRKRKEWKMTRKVVSNWVDTIICDQRGLDKKNYDRSVEVKRYGVDSIDEVEILMQIEDDFDIEIPDEKAMSIKTGNDAIEVVCSILGVE